MKPLENLLHNAARSQKRIVLSEGEDPRIVRAALDAHAQGIAHILLVGSETDIRAQFTQAGGTPDNEPEVHDPASSHLHEAMAEAFYQHRKHKGISREAAATEVRKSNTYAAMLVRMGHADGTVGGAVSTTADIVRTAIQIIGAKPGSKLISSFFLMLFCEDHHVKKGAHVFADCGLVVDPSAEEMAQIALASAASFAGLTREVPRVAMLSFSTRGSAKHSAVSKVIDATTLAKTADPELIIDGELQFDAAFVPNVAAAKASDSPLGGNANVFVFPSLESGNIAYKIAQRIGGATAIGPILQGLNKPANDLSRGCNAQDVLHMIAVTAAQAEALE